MLRSLFFAALALTPHCVAAAETGICESTTGPSESMTIRLERIENAKCVTARGDDQAGDIDVSFCANARVSTKSSDSESTMTFRAQCYAHADSRIADEWSVACTGFNGPWMTMAMIVNPNRSFASTFIYASTNGAANSVYIRRGTCTDETEALAQ